MSNLNAVLTARRVRRNKGFSLVEIAMVLAIIALLVAGVMLFFSNASNAQKTNDAMTELAAVQQVVRSIYAGQPSYNGLTSAVLASSAQLPNKWVSAAGGLVDPFAGAVTVVAVNTDQNFSVTMTNVPNASCNKMVTTDFGTGLLSVATNSGTAIPARAMTPTEANAACAAGNANTVTWEFF